MKRLLSLLPCYAIGAVLGALSVPIVLQMFILKIHEHERPLPCDGGSRSPTEGEIHTCGECGAELQIVRPGKYQCINCEWMSDIKWRKNHDAQNKVSIVGRSL
jgi:hypothetical protein